MPLVTTRGYNLQPDGLGALERGRQAATNEQMRGLQLESQELGLEGQKLGLQSQQMAQVGERDREAANAMISGAYQLKSLSDPRAKLEFLAQRNQEFKEAGLNNQGIETALNLARRGQWDELEASTDQLIELGAQMQGGDQTKFQFGGQKTFKDDKGNLFFGTSRRNPSTGEVESVISSVSGEDIQPQGALEEAGAYGLTAKEKVDQVGKEKGAADRASDLEQARNEYITSGTKAKGMLKDTKRLIDLNELISTGKTAAARKAFGDLFNVTDPNLGEFNSKAGQLVLNQIRLLGANPTEGERAFLLDISPSIEQGSAVNEALLKDLLRIQERQVDRARWFANNPTRTIEDYLLLEDEEDFKPTEGALTTTQDSGALNDEQLFQKYGIE